MRVLIGTTNQAKVNSFKNILKGLDIEFITLNDLNITDDIKETGKTPVENAIIKAKHYGKYYDYVICNDSGLYFENMSFDDVRQPGLNVRNVGNKRLNDDEMITYYATLAKEFSGQLQAYYLDGYAIYAKGNIYSFMDDSQDTKRLGLFIICDKPHPKRIVGWPIDSLSKNIITNNYYLDEEEFEESKEIIIIRKSYINSLRNFFINGLNLKNN